LRNIAFQLTIALFFISFTKGIWELLGINESMVQLIIDFIIISIFFISLIFITQKKSMVAPGFKIISTFFIIVVISYLLNNVTTTHLILFLRKFFIYVIFFYSIINIDFNEIQKNNILKLLIVLFTIQVLAAFIKLIVLGGTQEKIVGTISVMEGSLATIMPLLAISFLISMYLFKKRIIYIVYTLLFMAIGLISNKLGILFYIFILFIILTFLYTKKLTNSNLFNLPFLLYMSKIGFYLVVIFGLFVSLNPRANPENKVGGSIDIEYLSKYTEDYNTLQLKGSRVEADGRADAPGVALTKLSNGGLFNLILGYGPGDIVQSSLLKYENPLLEKYNMGYGARLGQVWILMQLGLLGLVVFAMYHIYIFKCLYNNFMSNNLNQEKNIILLGILGISIIFFMDFFTYSSQILYSPGVTLLYYYCIYHGLTITKKEII